MRITALAAISHIFIVGLIAGLSQAAFAQETYHFYTGARQMAMGGAYVTVVNDETALLTNPAGLGKIRDVTVTVLDPEVDGSFNTTGIATIDKIAKVTDINDLYLTLNGNRDQHWHAKTQIFPSVVGPNFGIGLHAKYSYDASVNAAGDKYRLDYTNDYAPVVGFCLRFFGGIVKLGTSVRYVSRIEVHKDLPAPPATTYQLQQVASEGTGLAADTGLVVTVPVAWLPTFGAVVRDIGTTSYAVRNGMIMTTNTRPDDTPQTVDVSVALFPIVSNRTRMSLTADYSDVTNAHKETDIMRNVHVGGEMNIADFFFLRAGMNQRYWTAGFEFATERFQLQGTTYGEEIGTRPAMLEDRRFMGKLSFRF